jgi:ectoine hydroxylase
MSLTDIDAVPDHYPTRLGHATEPIPRREPVVWTDEHHGPLTDLELRSVADNGYLIRPHTLEQDWLPPLREELQHIGSRAADDDPRIVREPSGGIRSVFQPHLLSEMIAEVVTLDTVLPVARQLLGSDVYIHQARINVMPGFKGSGFYWHSDFETWHAEDVMPSMRAVCGSISLTENFPYNGALMVMPGSHKTFYPCVGATPENHHRASMVRQEIGVPDEVTLTTMAHLYGIRQATGPAGTALWFDSNMMHGSGSNITPFPRSNIFLVFNSVENRLCTPFAATAPRPEYLAARSPEAVGVPAPS